MKRLLLIFLALAECVIQVLMPKKVRFKATMFGHKHLDPVTVRGKIKVASNNTDPLLFMSEANT